LGEEYRIFPLGKKKKGVEKKRNGAQSWWGGGRGNLKSWVWCQAATGVSYGGKTGISWREKKNDSAKANPREWGKKGGKENLSQREDSVCGNALRIAPRATPIEKKKKRGGANRSLVLGKKKLSSSQGMAAEKRVGEGGGKWGARAIVGVPIKKEGGKVRKKVARRGGKEARGGRRGDRPMGTVLGRKGGGEVKKNRGIEGLRGKGGGKRWKKNHQMGAGEKGRRRQKKKRGVDEEMLSRVREEKAQKKI